MGEQEFRLGGKQYTLSRRAVEEALSLVVPKEVRRYFILVSGHRYPPKQALAETLGLPLVSFTTMDANRILRTLGFELIRADAALGPPPRTESEQLFEEYLRVAGFTDFTFERDFENSRNRPDYCLPLGSGDVLFEVKEFHAAPGDVMPGGAYDPYRPIREKIEAARKKFKDFQDHCCALVLYNAERPLVVLSWRFIYAAMLGNLAIRTPIHVATAMQPTEAETGFANGGKMVQYRGQTPIAPQNTTISAILVLEQLPVGRRRLEAAVAAEEVQIGRELNLQEHLQRVEQARGTDRDVSLRQLRVVVHDNPYAGRLFPVDLFVGPYDERYGPAGGTISRTFAGQQIVNLPAERSPIAKLFSAKQNKDSASLTEQPVTPSGVLQGPARTREETRAWLDELAQFSDKIPPMPGETFSRQMIYQEHE